jgi:hypothetical protein
MNPVSEAEPAPPRPGLVKSIGVLNLVIGGFFFFCGTSCVNAVFPSFTTYEPIAIDARTVQEKYERFRRAKIDALQAREREAASEAERARARQERLAAEAEHQTVQDQIDLAKVNADLVWPTRYVWIDVISGAVLNLLILSSGLGLLQLAEWGRKLGLVVALSKVIRLVILYVLFTSVVVPHLSHALETFAASDLGGKLYKWSLEKEWKRQGRAVTGSLPAPRELVESFGVLGNVFLVIGSIYPMFCLIALSRPGARAACAQHDESESEDSAGQ